MHVMPEVKCTGEFYVIDDESLSSVNRGIGASLRPVHITATQLG
jgi:hypothetical protein